ncbi:MAG: hypothetical protein GKR89_14120 [Candidatus Latescibacteria bacterium]|nr:hypothetical protein [Candidatus Latescibacterota bacterium]
MTENPSANSPLLCFGLFADAHYAQLVYGDRHCSDSLEKLGVAIQVFQRDEVDFVVCLGDLIDKAEDKATELGYLAAMQQVLARYPGDCHYLLGNHDVATLTKAEYLARCGGRAYYVFIRGGIRFVVLDGNCHADGSDFNAGDFAWDQAWIGAAQLDWLAGQLRRGEEPVIILCHENLDDRSEAGVPDPHVLRNAAQVRDVLEQSGRVRAVFQGHYHPGLQRLVNGIPYIGLRAMVVGPGLGNNAFAVVEVGADGRICGRGFGQQADFSC